MTMKRIGPLAMLLAVVALSNACGESGEAENETGAEKNGPEKNETPAEAFNAARAAAERNDLGSVSSNMTPEGQTKLSQRIILMAKTFANSPTFATHGSFPLREAFARHGVSEKLEWVPGASNTLSPVKDEVENPTAFLADVSAELVDTPFEPLRPYIRPFVGHELGEVTIEGEHATSTHTSPEGGVWEIKFRRMNGSWLIDDEHDRLLHDPAGAGHEAR